MYGKVCGLLLAAILVLGLGQVCLAGELPVVNGRNWKSSSNDEKKAFLLGAATIIKLEHEIQGKEPLPKEKSLISSWVKGLSGYTLEEIMDSVDEYYSEHPDKLDRAVVEVIWYEFTLPNIEKK